MASKRYGGVKKTKKQNKKKKNDSSGIDQFLNFTGKLWVKYGFRR